MAGAAAVSALVVPLRALLVVAAELRVPARLPVPAEPLVPGPVPHQPELPVLAPRVLALVLLLA